MARTLGMHLIWWNIGHENMSLLNKTPDWTNRVYLAQSLKCLWYKSFSPVLLQLQDPNLM